MRLVCLKLAHACLKLVIQARVCFKRNTRAPALLNHFMKCTTSLVIKIHFTYIKVPQIERRSLFTNFCFENNCFSGH